MTRQSKPPISLEIIHIAEPEIRIQAEGFRIVELATRQPGTRSIYVGFGVPPSADINTDSAPEISKGWLIRTSPGTVLIYTDPIGALPLYLIKTADGYILSDFAGSFFGHPDFYPDIDPVGFWQSMAYESALRNRTLFKNIQQAGAGEEVILRHGAAIPQFRRYSCYEDIQVNDAPSEALIDQATDLVLAASDQEFGNDTGNHLLPLSGGVDSRLMAAVFSKRQSRECVKAVTYAASARSHEFTIAQEICHRLGFQRPHLHRLTPQSYLGGLAWLPGITGGTLPFSNVHLLDYLSAASTQNSPCTIVGTAFSDAICGYLASDGAKAPYDTWRQCGLLKRMSAVAALTSVQGNILEENDADIEALSHEWKRSSITSFDEFNYILERHTKFHHVLARSWMLFCPVKNIFYGKDLRDFFLSVPPQMRNRKALEIAIIDRISPQLSDIRSSSSMITDGRRATSKDKITMKAWNGFNTLVRSTIGARYEISNPYQTEELCRVLHLSLSGHLARARAFLEERNLFLPDSDMYFAKPVNRMGALGTLQYFAINAAETISIAESGKSLYFTEEEREQIQQRIGNSEITIERS